MKTPIRIQVQRLRPSATDYRTISFYRIEAILPCCLWAKNPMQFFLQEPFLEALNTPSCTVNHQLKHPNRNLAGSPRIPHHLAPKHTAGRPGSLALKRPDGPLGHCLEGWTLQAATLFPAPGIPELQVASSPGSRSSIKGFLRALSYRQELANSLFPVSWFLHCSQPYFSHQQELTVDYSLEGFCFQGQTDWGRQMATADGCRSEQALPATSSQHLKKTQFQIGGMWCTAYWKPSVPDSFRAIPAMLSI